MNFQYIKLRYFIVFICVLIYLMSVFIKFIFHLFPIDLKVNSTYVDYFTNISSLVFVLTLYNKFFWKLPIICNFNTMPIIEGCYSGEITYTNPITKKLEKKKCYMEIKQNASDIDVKCTFKKRGEHDTSSESHFAYIITKGLNQSLFFYYLNSGSNIAGDTLLTHMGVNQLEINKEKQSAFKNLIFKNKVKKLEGTYFTNREPQTKGTMILTKKEN